MSFVPGPSATRGGITVQPTYFTSSLYVDSCRGDIEALVQEFSQKYHENRDHSFSLFKSIWVSSGWQWMHFKVFDAYARDAFLKVTIRLFMGTILKCAIIIRLMDSFQSGLSRPKKCFFASEPCMVFTPCTPRNLRLLHPDCTRYPVSRYLSVEHFQLA